MFKIAKLTIDDILKFIADILKVYALYAAIFGVIIFGLHRPKATDYIDTHRVERFLGNEICQDRVALVEDRYESGIARISLIENAKESLDISYYTIHDGVSTNIFLGSILDAADRGVQVRFILDGLFHNLRGKLKDTIYAFSSHPNIELKFYEPFDFFRPWTWNNILHDKLVIVDDKLAMIGGRNIGDKYFAKEGYKKPTVDDRDVVIVNTDEENPKGSAVWQIKRYFNTLWDHEFSKYPAPALSKSQHRKGQDRIEYLSNYVEEVRQTRPHIFGNNIDWMEISLPTNNITLIHNPLQRLNKEPWCLYEIINLMKEAEHSIFIQSPYVIPTKKMLSPLSTEELMADRIDILTNSLAASPNFLASSGYRKYRKRIIDSGVNVYEFQGPGSIHAKSFIFDDRLSLVGSFNVDPRSAYLSTETMVVIDSEEFAAHLRDAIDDQIANSLLVGGDYSYQYSPKVDAKPVSTLKLWLVRVLSVIVYLFDYML